MLYSTAIGAAICAALTTTLNAAPIASSFTSSTHGTASYMPCPSSANVRVPSAIATSIIVAIRAAVIAAVATSSPTSRQYIAAATIAAVATSSPTSHPCTPRLPRRRLRQRLRCLQRAHHWPHKQ